MALEKITGLFFRTMSVCLTISVLSCTGEKTLLPEQLRYEHVINEESVEIKPSDAKRIERGVSLRSVIDSLGPAEKDIGSGRMILQWKMLDGGKLQIFVLGGDYNTGEVGEVKIIEPPSNMK